MRGTKGVVGGTKRGVRGVGGGAIDVRMAAEMIEEGDPLDEGFVAVVTEMLKPTM